MKSLFRFAALLSAFVITAGLAPHSTFGAGSREPAGQPAQTLTLYSGRGESLVDPIVRRFEDETGIRVNVRYGGTAELAVLLSEEGSRSPADLFWAQDAGALGAVSNLLAELPGRVFAALPDIYRSRAARWVATSGRARVLAYSTERANSGDVPASVFDLSDHRYAGRVGWAPTNGSFQSFVTAMRVSHGEQATRSWLIAMRENDTVAYRNNTALLEAIGAGEIDFAITNNYYLLRFAANDPNFPVAQSFFGARGDVGNLINVAGIGIPAASGKHDAAIRFVEFLLAEQAQIFFTGEVYEYPVTDKVEPNALLESFSTVLEFAPEIDLDSLEDLEATLALLREVELL